MTDNQTQESSPDSTPQVQQPSKAASFFRRFTKPPFNFVLIVVALILVMMLVRCGGSKPKPVTQELGVQRLKPQTPSPNETPDYIADSLKDRDSKAADKLLGSEQAINSGMGYMPTVTKEYDDPLADYSQSSAANVPKVPKEKPLDVPLPEVSTDGFDAGQQPPVPAATPASSDGEQVKPRHEGLFAAWTNVKAQRANLALGAEPAVAFPKGADDRDGGSARAATATQAAARGAAASSQPVGRVLARMGSDLYAVMDFDANSDDANYAAATVVGGPFNGAKLQGGFNRNRERLEVVFKTIAWKGGSYRIDALAFNPEHPEIGLATEVNNHYLSRFGGFFVATFLAAAGKEIADEGTTTTTNIGSGTVQTSKPDRSWEQIAVVGAGGTAGEVANVLRSGLVRPPTVKVGHSTPIGVRFRADWVETPTKTVEAATTAQIAGPTSGDSRAEVPNLEIQTLEAAGSAE